MESSKNISKANIMTSFGDFIFNKRHLRPLPEELQKKAEVELNEIPSRRSDDIEEFRNMVLKEHDLNANTSDAFLIRFLRARKFDKTRALQLLKNYYKLRMNNIFTREKLLPSNDIGVLEKDIFHILPHRDAQGRVIFYWRMEKWDPAEVDLISQLRAVLLCIEKILQDEAIQICGAVVLLDYTGFTFQHLRQCTPYLTYICISFLQDCAPFRVKGIHFVHENRFFDFLYAIMKPFLKKKLKERIFAHGDDLASLHEHIPADCLPTELGGTRGPASNEEWCQVLRNSEEEFMEDLTLGYV